MPGIAEDDPRVCTKGLAGQAHCSRANISLPGSETDTYYFENVTLWVGQRRRMTRLNLQKDCALKHHSEVICLDTFQ